MLWMGVRGQGSGRSKSQKINQGLMVPAVVYHNVMKEHERERHNRRAFGTQGAWQKQQHHTTLPGCVSQHHLAVAAGCQTSMVPSNHKHSI